MSTDVTRGLPRNWRGALRLAIDRGLGANPGAVGADDPLTRGLARDDDGNLLVELVGAKRVLTVPIPAQGVAGTIGQTLAGLAIAGKVTSVKFIPNVTITGAATDNRKFALVNLGAAGAGTTEVAGITFALATDAAALIPKTVPLSGTPANLNVAAGDVLSVVETVNGDGMAHGGGVFVIEITESPEALTV